MPLSRCEDGICAVYPGLVSLDIVAGGLSGANGVDELLLDAGDVAVEDALGFGAEGYQNVFAELRIIGAGFVGVDFGQFLPVEH